MCWIWPGPATGRRLACHFEPASRAKHFAPTGRRSGLITPGRGRTGWRSWASRILANCHSAAWRGFRPEAFARHVAGRGSGPQDVVVGADFLLRQGPHRDGAEIAERTSARRYGFDVTIARSAGQRSRMRFPHTAIRTRACRSGRARDASGRCMGALAPGSKGGAARREARSRAGLSDGENGPRRDCMCAAGRLAVGGRTFWTGRTGAASKGVANLASGPMFARRRPPNLRNLRVRVQRDLSRITCRSALSTGWRARPKFDSLEALTRRWTGTSAAPAPPCLRP